MHREPLHALAEAAEVLGQAAQVVLDHVHLAPGGLVLEHGPCRGQHGHEGGRRNHPHPRPLSLLDQLGEVGMDLGEHRLGRQEHHRAVGGLAGDQVLVGDVADVPAHVLAELPRRAHPLGLGLVRVEHALEALERELGVDRDPPGRLGQDQQAVDPGAVAQGVLQLEAVLGHQVAHQAGQLDLAEGAARALVGEHLLQADHVAGQLGDALLRLVDPAEVLEHTGEGLGGLVEALGQAPVDLAADLLQAAVGGPGQALDALAELVGGQAEGLADLAGHRRHAAGQGLLLALQGLALVLLGHLALPGQGRLERGTQLGRLALLGQPALGQAVADGLALGLETLDQLGLERGGILQRLPLQPGNALVDHVLQAHQASAQRLLHLLPALRHVVADFVAQFAQDGALVAQLGAQQRSQGRLANQDPGQQRERGQQAGRVDQVGQGPGAGQKLFNIFHVLGRGRAGAKLAVLCRFDATRSPGASRPAKATPVTAPPCWTCSLPRLGLPGKARPGQPVHHSTKGPPCAFFSRPWAVA